MGSILAIRGEHRNDYRDKLLRGLKASPHRGDDVEVASVGVVQMAVSRRDEDTTVDLVSVDDWVAALHGVIDNASELRDVLGLAMNVEGARLIIEAFRHWGPRAIGHMRGAFAGCVSDGISLWCFRDHLGSRPLFFRDHSGNFIAATEVKQVVAAAGIRREPNLEAIERLFYRGIGPETAVAGVMRLSHGGLVTVGSSGFQQEVHWNPGDLLESSKLDVQEAAECLGEMLEIVIPRQMSGSDAVALSGGIDSSTVATFAVHGGTGSGRRLVAYTAAYPDHPSVDETRYTLEIADSLGIPLETYQHTKRPLDDVVRWVDLADGPWDSLPAAMVLEGYELARSLGASTVHTGDLAEYVMTVRTGLLGHLLLRARFDPLFRQLAVRRSMGRSSVSLLKQLARDVMPSPLGRMYSRVVRRYSAFFPDWVEPEGHRHYRGDITSRARDRWASLQLSATRGTTAAIEANEILADSVGISVRRPLADRDLWEFFLSLRAEVKFPSPQPKALIRMAARGRVPDSVLDRTDKTVFDEHMLDTVPYDRLLHLIDDSQYRMSRVNYSLLRERLAKRDLAPAHLVWAYDLARTHAFVSLFT